VIYQIYCSEPEDNASWQTALDSQRSPAVPLESWKLGPLGHEVLIEHKVLQLHLVLNYYWVLQPYSLANYSNWWDNPR